MKLDPKCQKFLRKLGLKLRHMREERGWTLEQTEEFGWPSWQHLQTIETGKNITVATLWNLSRLYKVHPCKLLEDL